jgi:predicted MarR family transcription regulator
MTDTITKTVKTIQNRERPVSVEDITQAMDMLQCYVDTPDIQPLLRALETLKDNTQDAENLTHVITAFNDLNYLQGAVLTYAPYLHIFVSDDPLDY